MGLVTSSGQVATATKETTRKMIGMGMGKCGGRMAVGIRESGIGVFSMGMAR